MSGEWVDGLYGFLWAALAVLAALLLVVLTLAGWALTLLGLPGNWLMLGLAAVYAWLIPDSWRADIGMRWIVALLVLAALGELLEFAAGAVGTQRAGGSRRSAIGALVGSLIGGVFGATVALPIPVIGPIVGALLFGGVGAAVGAVAGELSVGSKSEDSWRVGWGAFWGRLLGTGAKTLVGAVMVAAVIVALFV